MPSASWGSSCSGIGTKGGETEEELDPPDVEALDLSVFISSLGGVDSLSFCSLIMSVLY